MPRTRKSAAERTREEEQRLAMVYAQLGEEAGKAAKVEARQPVPVAEDAGETPLGETPLGEALPVAAAVAEAPVHDALPLLPSVGHIEQSFQPHPDVLTLGPVPERTSEQVPVYSHAGHALVVGTLVDGCVFAARFTATYHGLLASVDRAVARHLCATPDYTVAPGYEPWLAMEEVPPALPVVELIAPETYPLVHVYSRDGHALVTVTLGAGEGAGESVVVRFLPSPEGLVAVVPQPVAEHLTACSGYERTPAGVGAAVIA